MRQQTHAFHLVDRSPWPFLLAFQLFFVVIILTGLLHGFSTSGRDLAIAVLLVIATMASWFGNVFTESTQLTHHTYIVKSSHRLGFTLFIVSEIMFFLSFFWAYFHFALAPTVQIGSVWPPYGMTLLDPLQTPLFNTVLLLTSGATITLAHQYILLKENPQEEERLLLLNILSEKYKARQKLKNSKKKIPYSEQDMKMLKRLAKLEASKNEDFYIPAAVKYIWVRRWIAATILLAILFTYNQCVEYIHAPFGMTDGIYASVFYMLTGFHGFHVIVGTIFLTVSLTRVIGGYYSRTDHFSFEAAAWYWHFVDVVWLYLYILLYLQF